MALQDDLRSWYAGLDAGRRSAMTGAAALALLAIVGVGLWSSYTPWAVLAERRSYDELLDAAAALDQAEIDYRIGDDGRLWVPNDRLGAARGALASSANLPGLADVSELQLGLTPAAQDWAFLRAREGDLARTIRGIDGISAAQVHIVPRGEALFVNEDRAASASVFLKLRPGARLDSSKVQAITRLVSGAVDGLDPSSVSVVDDRGNLLASGESNPENLEEMGQESLVRLRTELERRYERAVGQALLPVLGYAGGFSATATVELDPTSLETVTKRIDAQGQAVLSEQLDESSSDRSTSSGVPGWTSNSPDGAGPKPGDAKQERSATTANYVYPTVDEIARRPAGAIKRVSVAVQVDSAMVASLAKSGGSSEDDVKTSIQAAVAAAVGVDTKRGDTVEVRFLPFAALPEPEPVEASLPLGGDSWWSTALLGLLALAALAVVFRFLRPGAAPPPPAVLPALPDNSRPPNEKTEDLMVRLRRMVDRYEPVDARDLSALVDQQDQAAIQVLKRWRAKEGA